MMVMMEVQLQVVVRVRVGSVYRSAHNLSIHSLMLKWMECVALCSAFCDCLLVNVPRLYVKDLI